MASRIRLTENDLSRIKGDLVEGGINALLPGHEAELDAAQALAALAWQVSMGADEAISETPIDRFALHRERVAAKAPHPRASEAAEARPHPSAPAPAAPRPPEAPLGAAEAAAAGRAAAADCTSLAELRAALEAFDGCDSLKNAAENIVHFDGAETAPLLIIGEAPGPEEDRQGKPFVGQSGKLLDAMLGAIDLDRTKVHITNTVFWRPPGNRTPTDAEVAACAPFLMKQIELVQPRVLIAMGNPVAKAMLKTIKGITRIRGTWHDFNHPAFSEAIPAMPIFRLTSLLSNPAQKRYAWRDLLAVKARLKELGVL